MYALHFYRSSSGFRILDGFPKNGNQSLAIRRATPDRTETRQGRIRDVALFCETDQHGQGPLHLAIEMNLVTGEPFQLVGVNGVAIGLLTDERPAGELLTACLIPGQNLPLQETPEGVRTGGR